VDISLGPIGLLLAAFVFGVSASQLLLSPLRIRRSTSSVVGEVILALVCLLGLIPPFAELIGLVAFLTILLPLLPIFWPIIIGLLLFIYWYRSKNPNRKPGTPITLPKQYSLLEFLAVTVSVASLPLLFSAFGWGDAGSNLLFSVPVAFVLFLRAFSRLEQNRVPTGRQRALFLLLYPYLVIGTMYLSLVFFTTVGSSMFRRNTPRPSVALIALLGTTVAVGVWSAWQAKYAAEHHAGLNYDNFYNSPPPTAQPPTE
jgi:hypothetical protein